MRWSGRLDGQFHQGGFKSRIVTRPPGAHQADDIHALWKPGQVAAERVAQPPSHARPKDRVADPSAHADPQPRSIRVARTDQDDQPIVGRTPALRKYLTKRPV